MKSKTLTRSSTITNAKIAVATIAMLGALEVSLIVAPVAQQNKIVKKAPACIAEITSSLRGCKLRAGVVGHREYRFTCPSGKKYKMVAGCRSKADAQARVDASCLRNKQCIAPAAPVVAPAPAFPDMAFVGGATFYRDVEGRSKVKFRYTNRGSVDFPNDEQQRMNSTIWVTSLDANQQPLEDYNVQSEGITPLAASQVFDMAWDHFSESAAFIKFELQVGETINDSSVDRDFANNVMIVPVAQRPFPFGSNTIPDQYSDLYLSDVQVVGSSLTLQVSNQGNSPSQALEHGIEVRLKSSRPYQILHIQEFPLPAIAAQESTQIEVSLQLGATPDEFEIAIDPENRGNEPKLVYPNPYNENNRYGGPLYTSPSVVWAGDTPSGATASSIDQVVGKFLISNPVGSEEPLQIFTFNFQIHSSITVPQGQVRNMKIFKDNLATDPLFTSSFDPTAPFNPLRPMGQFRSYGEPILEVPPGESKIILVTIDTVDATPDNFVSIRLSPYQGMWWSKAGLYNSYHLNSASLLLKTLTY